ncbi:MAG: hypothetical protein IJS19_01625 [Muribaculaceae bacterium]|nr:hypothetical protein [Muribaculaceae bacterium]
MRVLDKRMSQTRTKYITLIPKANGDTIQRVNYYLHTERFYGDFVKIDNSRWRVYHQSGHVDITSAGVQTWAYYVRDRLGSTRVVINAQGVPLQAFDYYPSGIPVETYNTNNTYAATNRLHTGKEFHAFDGLSWHDNAARFHDTLFPRFTTVDPLAERAPDVSPYVYCGDNPLRFIDPSGMIERDKNGKIIFSNSGKSKFIYLNEVNNSYASGYSKSGTISTDKGRDITVIDNRSFSGTHWGNSDITTNCFGLVFADGEYWLENSNDQIQKILDDDGYSEVGIEDAQVGDVVIYNEGDGTKGHAATISETDGTFDGTLIFGKGGDDIKPSYLPIKDGYNRPDNHGHIVQTPTSHIHIYRPPEKDKKNDDNKENRERIQNEITQPL